MRYFHYFRGHLIHHPSLTTVFEMLLSPDVNNSSVHFRLHMPASSLPETDDIRSEEFCILRCQTEQYSKNYAALQSNPLPLSSV